jgi:hypothetical protein
MFLYNFGNKNYSILLILHKITEKYIVVNIYQLYQLYYNLFLIQKIFLK